jgi:murein DD-endopeptidase MepM/ murein hydrolase activator NlpD
MFKKTNLSCCLILICLLATPQSVLAKDKNKMVQGEGQHKDRVARDFRHADTDGDGFLSQSEWMRRGNFTHLDHNKDGVISLDELRALYRANEDQDYSWPPKDMSPRATDIDPSIEKDRIASSQISSNVLCGIARSKGCGTEPQKERGLLATGTGPRFPETAQCPGIDDYWAMDYTSKRNNEAYHGGIDLPVHWGTPMRAIADGSVVAKYDADQSKRGIEIVLRHSPEQTALPHWIYSAYGHMDRSSDLEVGQKVKMGDILGPTGNSGNSAKGSQQSSTRRPAIHLALFYSPTASYSEYNATIIPLEGRWLDPMAFYRQKGPFDSLEVMALPESEKEVLIPILFEDGSTLPQNTKIIWPYACAQSH